MDLISELSIFSFTIRAQAEPLTLGSSLSRLYDVSNNLSSDGLINTNWLLISVGALLLLVSGISIVRWYKYWDKLSHPLLVFTGTAGIAGLGYRDQCLLLWITYRSPLTSPLTLLLSPATFEHYIKAYFDRRPKWHLPGTRQRAQAIGSTLFADLTETAG